MNKKLEYSQKCYTSISYDVNPYHFMIFTSSVLDVDSLCRAYANIKAHIFVDI